MRPALLWLASEMGKGEVCSEHVSCFRARAIQTTATIRIIHAFNFRVICSTNFMHRKETLILLSPSLSLSLIHSAESKATEQQTKCSTFLHNHLLSYPPSPRSLPLFTLLLFLLCRCCWCSCCCCCSFFCESVSWFCGLVKVLAAACGDTLVQQRARGRQREWQCGR